MSSKHTPGPWTYQEDSDAYTHIVRGPNNRFICQLNQSTSAEIEANARLIATAPELLDALIEAVDCGMVPISSAKDGGASTHSRQVRCADMIRAALAKAAGEGA